MNTRLTRRELLACGLGAAGALAGAGLPRGGGADRHRSPATRRSDLTEQAPSLPVAILRCESYEPQLLRRRLDEALELIGGIRKLVENKTVTVKLNLTGGQAGKLGGLEPHRTYHVHPRIVAAACAALADAGAKRIMLVEGHYTRRPVEEFLGWLGWDVAEIKSAGAGRVQFLDTRNRGPFGKYSRLAVPWGGFIFPAFDVNAAYQKTDVYVSLAKMKDHGAAGITLACKNNFGVPPQALYGDDAPNEESTRARNQLFHFGRRKVPAGVPGEVDHGFAVGDWQHRVPRVTADTVGARPIDLAIIDGIETNRGGEGPWIKGVEPIQPRLILVGRNAVCTDAVCAAVMGYDPLADHHQFPFQGENHLRLLASVGVGAIDPKRIEVRGLPLEKALHPFNPKRLEVKHPLSYHPGDWALWQEHEGA
ncbi:MAG: DUF362 domain-containing protein [Thermoguttaceae bacterium]